MRLQCSILQTTSTESAQYSAALGSKTSTFFLGGFEESILIFVTSSLHPLYPHSAARNSAFLAGNKNASAGHSQEHEDEIHHSHRDSAPGHYCLLFSLLVPNDSNRIAAQEWHQLPAPGIFSGRLRSCTK